MKNLYSRLYSAGSVHRERLEDFLTEALVDLLSRISTDANLSREDQLAFCSDIIFSENTRHLAVWRSYASLGELRWESQSSVVVPDVANPKRPDIILFREIGGKSEPILVIECKIGAPADKEQLSNYDEWLQEQHELSRFRPALVFLTHLSDPPVDFLDGGYRSQTYVSRWSQVYQWLNDHKRQLRWTAACQTLAAELASFLKEKELMTESPLLDDFAAARLYVGGGSHQRFASAISAARKKVSADSGKMRWKLKNWVKSPPDIVNQAEGGWIYDGVSKQDWSAEFCWGIFFVREKDSADFWAGYDPPIKQFQGVFLELSSKKVIPKKAIRPEWHAPDHRDDGRYRFYKVASFDKLMGDFTVMFSNWAAAAFAEAWDMQKKSSDS